MDEMLKEMSKKISPNLHMMQHVYRTGKYPPVTGKYHLVTGKYGPAAGNYAPATGKSWLK